MIKFKLTTKLYNHQIAAFNKIKKLRIGALFMDMGTGKSRTAIELIKYRSDKIDKVIWICPVSLRHTVKSEIIKHTDIKEDDIIVVETYKSFSKYSKSVYIIGIESISGSTSAALILNKLVTGETFVIVDESSFIKSHNAACTKIITSICAICKYKLIMSGTPVTQGIEDLFSQLFFLSPCILGYRSYYAFASKHLTFSDTCINMIVDHTNVEYIAEKVASVSYQVKKKECLDLPPKQYIKRFFGLSVEQHNDYICIKRDMLEKLAGDSDTSILIFMLYTALQQVVSGFVNTELYDLPKDREGKSYKIFKFENTRLACLCEVLREIDPNEKVVIWVQYTFDVQAIKEMLVKEYGKRSVCIFTGEMSPSQREIELRRFRNRARFFISIPSCGGYGLNLVESSYCIFYNNSFKYAERIQAEDRIHRIGQTRSTTYIDLVSNSGIDERIQYALKYKKDVVDVFHNDVDKLKDEV